MGVLLRLDGTNFLFKKGSKPNYNLIGIAISVTELGRDESSDNQPNYALWVYYDKDQCCFVELHDDHPSRQPEFYVKGSNRSIQIELFRKKSPLEEERVLLGEAIIPVSFLLHTTEAHLIVEVLRDETEIVATVLLKVEKFDTKRHSQSRTASGLSLPAATFKSTSASSMETLKILSSRLSENSSRTSFISILYHKLLCRV